MVAATRETTRNLLLLTGLTFLVPHSAWQAADMGVKKLKSRTMLYSRLLSGSSEDVRRSAREKVRAARGTIHQSNNIIEQAHQALQKAERIVRKSVSERKERAARREAFNSAKKRR